MADVIELLEHDHREVEQMFTEYEQTTDPQQRRGIVDKIIIELVRHSEAEEQAVYPMMKKKIEGGEALVEHEIKEHSEAEQVMKRLDGMDPTDPKFGVLVQQLMTEIKEHVREEEGEAFPKFRAAVDQEELDKLGETVQKLKKIVPTHPHPMAPDHPPFNALLAPGAALVDRVRDMLTGRGKD
ncbi:MAG TPA: hemerythrin domain-containing protein [Mycobacteriales bacterium]|nr:hemerythrin domain-containing protein [Mycobacteriales bacterium]